MTILKICAQGIWLATVRSVVVLLVILFVWSATDTDPVVERPKRGGQQAKVDAMLDWYGCWRAAFVDFYDAEPTHAVVTRKGGNPKLVSAKRGLDIYHHPKRHPGMTVHGVCEVNY